jgi:protocatechuate 3,4-dioxygenase beta subunit
MKILRLRRLSSGEYRIVVHLDITKVDGNGEPLPDYVVDLRWPARPDGMTHADYLQQERSTIRSLCQGVLAHREATEGAALPGEGETL